MQIALNGPTFFEASDEDRFFDWLQGLPSVESVIGAGTELLVSLREPIDDSTLLGLLILCHRWRIDMEPLRALASSAPEWFASTDSWFSELLWGHA